VGDLEQLAREIIHRLLRALALGPDIIDDNDWMHRLVQSLQSGSGSLDTDPPNDLCV
jgi:hypothetical protein